jgi:GGDEF domain-containing protein
MLQSAAAAWATAPRATDTMFRYGGEEFRGPAARLPAEDAAAALERLREVTPLSQAFSAGLACWDRQKAAISATSSTGLTAARRLTLTDLDLQGL